ncbi:MAG: hypothetical protein LBP98_04715 [Tannerella sp.]|jgi:hypothetical protein|nr:hypothetical protein [Tannerella sp.]
MTRGSKADEALTLLFMLLAVAAVICFFVAGNRMVFLVCGGVAVLLRMVQYILRFFP